MGVMTVDPPPARHAVPVAARPDRMISRARIIARLRSDVGPIVVVEAAAGAGKSTLLAEWALDDARPGAWLTIQPSHADPVALVGALSHAIGAVEPASPSWGRPRRLLGADPWRSLARLTRLLSEELEPTLLVVDDIHRLTDPIALDLVVTLAERFPAEGRVALATRSGHGLPLARWQLGGHVLYLDQADLNLDEAECALLLERLGVPDAARLAPEVRRRTEGWAAGVHLMGLAARQDAVGPDRIDPVTTLAEGYLRRELLDRLDPATRAMLTQTAHLDVVTGPLADALCGASGSAQRLEAVADQGILVMPVDGTRTTYRYHSLLRDVLTQDLAQDPPVDLEVRLRAAAWYEAAGMTAEAIEQALGAGDMGHAARLVVGVAQAKYRTGEVAPILRWVDALDDEAAPSRPDLAAVAAYVHALEGNASAATRWAAVMEVDRPGSTCDVDAPGTSLVSAMLCARGPDAMHADALRALGDHDERWRWRSSALFACGMAALMLDQRDEADARFRELERIHGVNAATVRLTARAERVLAMIGERRWGAAQAVVALDRATVLADPESGRIAGLLWLVADAHLAMHQGDVEAAWERLRRVQVGRARLSWALPWLAVRTLTELARVQLLIGDHQGARVSLSQARDTLDVRPDLGRLVDDLGSVTQQALAAPRGSEGWSTLTRAELRLLPLLQTHLTIKEIGQRLGVSPNTAKTQALSIYGKLGASTRSEAIEMAVAQGLLEDMLANRP